MQATPDLSDDLLQWPYLSLLLSSLAFGVVYLLYLFEIAPTLIGIFPRREITFLLGQLSVSLFAAYLVVVFVTRSDVISTSPQPPAQPDRPATAARSVGNGGTDVADDTGSDIDGDIGSDIDDDAADENHRSDEDRAREAALTQFTQALDEHLAMLCAWYIAAHPEPPAEPPASYEAFFEGEFAEIVRRLDFSTPHDAPGSPDATWLAWSALRLTEFRRETMAIIEVHAGSIEPTVTERLHNLANSRLTKRVITADEADLPGHLPADTALLLFTDADSDDPLEAHLDILREVLATHETDAASSLTPIGDRDCWAGESPDPGVAWAAPDSDAEQYYKLF